MMTTTTFNDHAILKSGSFSRNEEGFNSLPLDLIRHIFLMIFKDKDHFNVFSSASQVSKSFYFLLDWSTILYSPSIPSQMPFEHYHFIAAIRKGRSYSVEQLDNVLKKKKSEDQLQVECKAPDHPDNAACPFTTAIKAGQIEIFKELFKKQSYDFNIMEIFKIAILKGSLEVLEFLEENNYFISEIKNNDVIEQVPIFAIQSKNIKMLEKILPKDDQALNNKKKYKASLCEAISQFTPATKQQDLQIIQYLFTNKGPKIMPERNKYSSTMNDVIESTKNGDQDLSVLLWDSGLFKFRNDYFSYACEYGHDQLVAKFLKHPECVIEKNIWPSIDLAMKGKHLKVIKNCLKSPKITIVPLIKNNLEMIKYVAQMTFSFFIGLAFSFVFSTVIGIAGTCLIDLAAIKISAIIHTGSFAITSLIAIATGIIFVVGSLLSHLYKTARAVGFLAYHEIKIRLLA